MFNESGLILCPTELASLCTYQCSPFIIVNNIVHGFMHHHNNYSPQQQQHRRQHCAWFYAQPQQQLQQCTTNSNDDDNIGDGLILHSRNKNLFLKSSFLLAGSRDLGYSAKVLVDVKQKNKY